MTGGHPVRADTDTRGWRAEAGTLEKAFDAYRQELRSYCRRILGSDFEADDAVQETMVRAWCRIDSFEGRSSLRSWLYRIATNVCLDMRRQPERRAQPIDPGSRPAPAARRTAPRRNPRGFRPRTLVGPARTTANRPSWPPRVRRSVSPSWPPCSFCRRGSGPC